MKTYIIIAVLLSGCASEQIISKYPNQENNKNNAPSFHNACVEGTYGEWSKGFMCAKLSK